MNSTVIAYRCPYHQGMSVNRVSTRHCSFVRGGPDNRTYHTIHIRDCAATHFEFIHKYNINSRNEIIELQEAVPTTDLIPLTSLEPKLAWPYVLRIMSFIVDLYCQLADTNILNTVSTTRKNQRLVLEYSLAVDTHIEQLITLNRFTFVRLRDRKNRKVRNQMHMLLPLFLELLYHGGGSGSSGSSSAVAASSTSSSSSANGGSINNRTCAQGTACKLKHLSERFIDGDYNPLHLVYCVPNQQFLDSMQVICYLIQMDYSKFEQIYQKFT